MTTFFHPSQLKCLSFEFSIMEVTPFLKTSIFASALITKRKSQYSTRTLDSTRMHSSMMRTTRSSSHLLGGVSASVHARIPPWVWAWRPPPKCGPGDPPGVSLETPCPGQTPQLPPWVWAWRPPSGQIPQLPLGCGPGDLQGMLGYHPPPGYLQGMLGCHLQCRLGYLPWTEFLTHASENITLPVTSFEGGKNSALACKPQSGNLRHPKVQSVSF